MFTNNFLYHLKDLNFTYAAERGFVANLKNFRHMPNREEFDPNNQYEMVLLINSLQKLWNLETLEDCRKIEFLIKTQMPPTINTQLEVADWLVINWNSFENNTLSVQAI